MRAPFRWPRTNRPRRARPGLSGSGARGDVIPWNADVINRARVADRSASFMVEWTVAGSFFARRGDWQVFSKRCEAPTAAQAREWALSEIGGCHHVKRSRVRIVSVTESG